MNESRSFFYFANVDNVKIMWFNNTDYGKNVGSSNRTCLKVETYTWERSALSSDQLADHQQKPSRSIRAFHSVWPHRWGAAQQQSLCANSTNWSSWYCVRTGLAYYDLYKFQHFVFSVPQRHRMAVFPPCSKNCPLTFVFKSGWQLCRIGISLNKK